MKRAFIIELMVDGDQISLNVGDDIAINPGDLEGEMLTMAPLLAWYGRLLASAKANLANAEGNFKAYRGKYLSDLLVQHPKLAEWKARKQMESERRHRVELTSVIDSQELVDKLVNAYFALKTKADMVRAINANRRHEYTATTTST